MIKLTAAAKFPQLKPAHHAFIAKTGEGTNFYRAAKDAIEKLSKDERLKGKRAKNLSGCTITFSIIEDIETED